MTPGLRIEGEIDLAHHPLVVEFGEQSGDQAQAGIGVREGPPNGWLNLPH